MPLATTCGSLHVIASEAKQSIIKRHEKYGIRQGIGSAIIFETHRTVFCAVVLD